MVLVSTMSSAASTSSLAESAIVGARFDSDHGLLSRCGLRYSAAVAEGKLTALEVAEELLPFSVGGGAIFRCGGTGRPRPQHAPLVSAPFTRPAVEGLQTGKWDRNTTHRSFSTRARENPITCATAALRLSYRTLPVGTPLICGSRCQSGAPPVA